MTSSYNLTDNQKAILSWLVEQYRAGTLDEEFVFHSAWGSTTVAGYTGTTPVPPIAPSAVRAIESANLLLITDVPSRHGGVVDLRCTLLGDAFTAVDTNFAAPDTGFVRHLTPLADVTDLDPELKARCLPMLGAGSADPTLWDSAVRTATVILENRLRTTGGVADPTKTGLVLVNTVFGKDGSLAARFTVDAEREGYRSLYAGIISVVRNRYGHRLMDPVPADGGAILVFIDLLLKMLEDLREEPPAPTGQI